MPNVKVYAKEGDAHKLAELFRSREERIEGVYEAKLLLAIAEDDMRLHIASDTDLTRMFLKVDYNAIRRGLPDLLEEKKYAAKRERYAIAKEAYLTNKRAVGRERADIRRKLKDE